MYDLTIEDVTYIHDQIINASGGLAGIKDRGQLKSCLARPKQSAFGEEIYKDLFQKAAALLECLANTHPFIDGNKRTAMAAAALFLQIHNVKVNFSNKEYEDFMLKVVNDKPSNDVIKKWLMQHSDA